MDLFKSSDFSFGRKPQQSQQNVYGTNYGEVQPSTIGTFNQKLTGKIGPATTPSNQVNYQSNPIIKPKQIGKVNFFHAKPKKKPKVAEVKCKICNITVSSQVVYEAHIQGRKHLKKEDEARRYNCELCLTQLLTEEELKAHNETEAHLESVKVSEFFQQQKDEDPEYQKKLAVKAYTGKYLTSKEIEELKEMADSAQHWHVCKLCDVKCNSEQMLELHKGSKKHKTREEEAKLNKKSVTLAFSCKICSFLCHTETEQEAHLKSEEHLKIVRKKKDEGVLTTPNDNLWTEIVSEDKPDVVPYKDPNNVVWFRCELCDVKMNSLDNYKAHVNSKKHIKKLNGEPVESKYKKKKEYSSEALRNSYTRFVSGGQIGKKITGDPSAFCVRCEIQFDTSTDLEQHFLTPAHRNQNPYKKKMHFEPDANRKKVKSVATTSPTQTSPIPLPTSDYGYGYKMHQEPSISFPDNSKTACPNNWSNPPTFNNYSDKYSNPPTFNNYSNKYSSPPNQYLSQYQNTSNVDNNRFGNPATQSYNGGSSSNYSSYNSRQSYQNNSSNYSYSTPFYQH